MAEALEVAHKTEALSREIGNKKGLSRALNGIASILGEMGRDEESLSYFYRSLDVARESGDLPQQFTALENIGEV